MRAKAFVQLPCVSKAKAALLAVAPLILALVVPSAFYGCDDDPKRPGPELDASPDVEPDSDVVIPGGNRAPVISRIGNRKARIGKLLEIELEATDPDGDALSFTVFGKLPEDAKFSKESHRFEWTPEEKDAGEVLLLTFAVSDGELDDRETIQIRVVSDDTQSPPQLESIGDVFASPGEELRLQLQASDEDGDPLSFTAQGLPSTASFDTGSGLMLWTPEDSDLGSSFDVVFSVTDGQATASIDVRIIVEEVRFGIDDLPPQSVVLGEKLLLRLPIINPDDWPYTCAMNSPPRDGASFVDCTLRYTPTDPALVNTTVDFIFSVEAQGYSWLRRVTVSIVPAQVDCVPDAFESNDSPDSASSLSAGSYDELSVCGDEDWYAINLEADQSLTVELLFEHGPSSDLDLYLYSPSSESPVAVSDGSVDGEKATVPQTEAGEYLIRVFEFSDASASYAMQLNVGGASCVNDPQEPNNTRSEAWPLGADALLWVEDGMLCPGENDWFAVQHDSDGAFAATLVFDANAGDLDLELFDAQGTLVAFSRRPSDLEEIELASLPSGTYALRVYGYQNASAEYVLEVEQGGEQACEADTFEDNDDPGSAALLTLGQYSASFCGDPDYFSVPFEPLQRLSIRTTWNTGGALRFSLLSANGAVLLADSTPIPNGAELIHDNDDSQRTLLLEIADGNLGTEYNLEVAAVAPPCDPLSCPAGEVCNDSAVCVTETCSLDADCPSEYRCRQGHCVNPCFVQSDCRSQLGYACRLLQVTDVVPFCAPSGTGNSGSACESMADCSESLACLQGPSFPNGTCAAIGCSSDADCDFDSTCIEQNNAPLCLTYCFENGDCRGPEGYQCLPRPATDGSGNIEVCIAP
ncbi:MAG: pre-peptidase C-terminal domain-containing protein [Myxococcota bacterium]|jgi:hypothetical protein|nr:pre-peptidase C-terminal domain-containing protein [Myxococcota bacterium]